jgi:hypothetical protein
LQTAGIGANAGDPITWATRFELFNDGNIQLAGLTASTALALDASKNIISVAGIDTTFVDADGNTITVTKGIITAKTAP